ncbi:PIR Superfamily Protein [Plasmodium ovale curtisi]|uniref:PIR Superfamily Protein n=1 Tax=Plasmodium ovale curtisi TaxID=864141 RepID=A0A1A8XBS7_PLAOA|nr:PIR Superfamily Protein [Plasmodium ovale curtisi]SBT02654.1 PIR Superfamily Protein [Plasmodium ovale curtisi]
MSSRINTAYNFTSSYNEYKHKLNSLTSPSDTTWIPGCDDFTYSYLYKKLNDIFNEENDGDNKFDKCIHQMNKDTCDKIQQIFSLHETFNIFENQEPSDVAEKKCSSSCAELFRDQYLLQPVEILDTGVIVAPFVLILVISLILPLLYKFTPFGPWIHQRIGKNQNILNNIIEEENHFIDNYEMKKDDSKKRYYKLLYNSS